MPSNRNTNSKRTHTNHKHIHTTRHRHKQTITQQNIPTSQNNHSGGHERAQHKLGGSKNNALGNIIKEIITEHNLTVINTGQATRVLTNQSNSNSVIDLSIITQDLALSCNHYVENTSLGFDHLVTITKVNEAIVLEEEMSMNPWKINKANWQQFKTESKHSITENLIETDINNTYKKITAAITDLGNSNIARRKQIKNKERRHRPLPFWNEKCSKAIHNRNRIRNKMKKSKDLNDYIAYKQQNAKTKRIIADEARGSWEAYCSELTDQSKLGVVWNMARRMNGVASRTTIPTLKHNGQTAETNMQKANILANTYAETSSTSNYKQEFLDHIQRQDQQSNNTTNTTHSIDNEEVASINAEFDLKEMREAINSAKSNKSPGEDRIPYDLLRHLHKHALKVLLTFFNRIWGEGDLPTDWKHAIIVPILKPTNDPSLPESYRPISLTSAICKTMEKMASSWKMENGGSLRKTKS